MPAAIVDLTGRWEFRQYPVSARRMRDLDEGGWQAGSVPASIFDNLIEAGQVNPVDIARNPEAFQWVSQRPWVYRKTFNVPAQTLDCSRIDLVFEGLDTITTVWLNGKLIARTDNMFIAFRFDVTDLLKSRDNSLLVKFDPPAEYARKLMSRYGRLSRTASQDSSCVYIRKARFQFGSDFCPSLPGCGIFRPVRLEGVKKARFSELHFRTIDANHKYADIKIEAKLDKLTREKFLCEMTVRAGNQKFTHTLSFDSSHDSHSAVIRIENPLLWWPRGYGRPNLYRFDGRLLCEKQTIDKIQAEFGIRTASLNRKKDKHGENFQFQVNERTIFAKGANWINPSVFSASSGRADYEKLLGIVAEANINMVRLWGGGCYESEEFYSLCDRLGIMVWQDFMFSRGLYSDRKWFISQINTEAAAVIKRLRNHPSLMLFCGNDGIELMHKSHNSGRSRRFHGRKIYYDILPRLVAELSPGTAYIPTTPLFSDSNSHPCRQLTAHQWQIWSGHQPVRKYLCPAEQVPRFVTEFGLQSLPEAETVRSFCSSSGFGTASAQLEKHNYQPDGNSRLYRYTADLFGPVKKLDRFIYLSQLTQARAAKSYVEHLRAHNHINNGVLFWHFNDCCPAVSFSAIDHLCRPKALYYYARRFFSNLLVAFIPEFEEQQSALHEQLKSLSVVAVNDTARPVTAMLSCRLIDLSGGIIDSVEFPVSVGQFAKSSPVRLPRAFTFVQHPHSSCLQVLMKKHGKRIAENLFFYLPDKHIDWPQAEIAADMVQKGRNEHVLELKSNAVTRDVQIQAPPSMVFEDNFIDLTPAHHRQIPIRHSGQIPFSASDIYLRCVNELFSTGRF